MKRFLVGNWNYRHGATYFDRIWQTLSWKDDVLPEMVIRDRIWASGKKKTSFSTGNDISRADTTWPILIWKWLFLTGNDIFRIETTFFGRIWWTPTWKDDFHPEMAFTNRKWQFQTGNHVFQLGMSNSETISDM